jgi:hypothetical protein
LRQFTAAFAVLGLLAVPSGVTGQGIEVRGEASLAAIASEATKADRELIARYVPEVLGSWPLAMSWTVSFDVSAEGYASVAWNGTQRGASERDADLYRAWVRIGSPRFEVRAGLQKITFGSGTIFRPLMWFDRIDPRDPLQVTEGVSAVPPGRAASRRNRQTASRRPDATPRPPGGRIWRRGSRPTGGCSSTSRAVRPSGSLTT